MSLVKSKQPFTQLLVPHKVANVVFVEREKIMNDTNTLPPELKKEIKGVNVRVRLIGAIENPDTGDAQILSSQTGVAAVIIEGQDYYEKEINEVADLIKKKFGI